MVAVFTVRNTDVIRPGLLAHGMQREIALKAKAESCHHRGPVPNQIRCQVETVVFQACREVSDALG